MKRMKRYVSLLLAVVILTAAPLTVHAEETDVAALAADAEVTESATEEALADEAMGAPADEETGAPADEAADAELDAPTVFDLIDAADDDPTDAAADKELAATGADDEPEEVIPEPGENAVAYAYYDSDAKTLYFRYDENKPSSSYAWETSGTGRAKWSPFVMHAEHVVIEPSFSYARPVSTAGWFRALGFYADNADVTIEGLKYLNTSETTDMSQMFTDARALTSLDLSTFDVSKVTNMYMLFCGCLKLAEINFGDQWDTSSVTNMSLMFARCNSLGSLDLSAFDTSAVTDISQMLSNCQSLEELSLHGLDFSNLTLIDGLFEGCSALEKVDMSELDLSNVLSVDDLFNNCPALKSVDMSNVDLHNVTSLYSLFSGCYTLTDINISGMNVENVTDVTFMFRECKNLESADLSVLDTDKVQAMYGMFSDCTSLTSVDMTGFDTDNVTDMRYLFEGCSSMESFYPGSFSTSNVINMSGMFKGCSALKSIDLSEFDTAKVTKMNGMFDGCSSLKELDLQCFDVSSCKDFEFMFRDCSALEKIIVASVDTVWSGDPSARDMFTNCNSLVGYGASYNGNRTGSDMARVVAGYFTAYDIPEGVAYFDRYWDGSAVQEELKWCENYTDVSTLVSRPGVALNSGWYSVTKDKSLSNCLDIHGDVKLILCAGTTFNCNDGIYLMDGCHLTIYSQHDDGTLNSISNDSDDDAGIGGLKSQKSGALTIKGGKINAQGGDNAAGIGGGKDRSSASVEIYGGTVKARSEDGAGIGGGKGGSQGGTIYIYGGNVTAASEDGAGIGGGDYSNGGGSGGTVYIYGGTVNASSSFGAGIGGGNDKENGTIHILGGSVTATSEYGAGIGPGEAKNNRQGGDIYIENAEVVAQATAGYSAGIGGAGGARIINSGGGSATYISIKSSVVTATSICGAGIGGAGDVTGSDGGHGGTIIIEDSAVFAASAQKGAGIGGGNDGNGADITIKASMVTAIGGCTSSDNILDIVKDSVSDYADMFKNLEWKKILSSFTYQGPLYIFSQTIKKWLLSGDFAGAGIGGGDDANGGTVNILDDSVVIVACGKNTARAIGRGDGGSSDGTLNIYQGAKVTAGNDAKSAVVQKRANRVSACQNNMYAKIEPCEHPGATYTDSEDKYTHMLNCDYCGKGGQLLNHEFEPNGVCKDCGFKSTLTLKKEWNAADGIDRPEEVTVHVKSEWKEDDGSFTATEQDYTLNEENQWQMDIPMVFLRHRLTFTEAEVSGYAPESWSLRYDDGDNDTIKLPEDSAAGKGSAVLDLLPVDKDDPDTWTDEDRQHNSDLSFYRAAYDKYASPMLTLTNVVTDKTITINKEWDIDLEKKDRPDSIEVLIQAKNGDKWENTKIVTISADDDWTATANVPINRDKDGSAEKIEYRVRELKEESLYSEFMSSIKDSVNSGKDKYDEWLQKLKEEPSGIFEKLPESIQNAANQGYEKLLEALSAKPDELYDKLIEILEKETVGIRIVYDEDDSDKNGGKDKKENEDDDDDDDETNRVTYNVGEYESVVSGGKVEAHTTTYQVEYENDGDEYTITNKAIQVIDLHKWWLNLDLSDKDDDNDDDDDDDDDDDQPDSAWLVLLCKPSNGAVDNAKDLASAAGVDLGGVLDYEFPVLDPIDGGMGAFEMLGEVVDIDLSFLDKLTKIPKVGIVKVTEDDDWKATIVDTKYTSGIPKEYKGAELSSEVIRQLVKYLSGGTLDLPISYNPFDNYISVPTKAIPAARWLELDDLDMSDLIDAGKSISREDLENLKPQDLVFDKTKLMVNVINVQIETGSDDDEEVGKLMITATRPDSNKAKEQSFVYKVKGSDTELTVAIILGAGETQNSVTIADLPAGDYTVTEESKWSWRYSDGGEKSATVDSDTAEVTFDHTLSIKDWLNGYAHHVKKGAQ